jgi:hypothetical protein
MRVAGCSCAHRSVLFWHFLGTAEGALFSARSQALAGTGAFHVLFLAAAWRQFSSRAAAVLRATQLFGLALGSAFGRLREAGATATSGAFGRPRMPKWAP